MISRRGLFAIGLGMGLSRGAIGALSTDLDPLHTFVRIRTFGTGKRAYWWYSGHVLGRLAGEPAVPMLSVVGASYSEITPAVDDGYIYDLVEAGYYGDPVTGEISDELANPLTGEPIKPEHYRSSQSLLFRSDLTIWPNIENMPDGLEFTGRITPPDVKAGRVWMAEELFVKFLSGGATRFANSLANFQATLADLQDPQQPFVAASMEYTTINSFRPWMGMKESLGTMSMRLNGVKLSDPGDIPDALTDRINRDHPGFWSEHGRR